MVKQLFSSILLINWQIKKAEMKALWHSKQAYANKWFIVSYSRVPIIWAPYCCIGKQMKSRTTYALLMGSKDWLRL